MDRMNSSGKVNNNEPFCANGCRFYGHPSTQNLCSKCYKELILQRFSKVTIAETSTPAGSDKNIGTSTMKKNRCQSCNKKIGLLGFACRCGRSFCGFHRYPETHACSIDFKTPGRSAVAKQNPFCKADKLPDRL